MPARRARPAGPAALSVRLWPGSPDRGRRHGVHRKSGTAVSRRSPCVGEGWRAQFGRAFERLRPRV